MPSCSVRRVGRERTFSSHFAWTTTPQLRQLLPCLVNPQMLPSQTRHFVGTVKLALLKSCARPSPVSSPSASVNLARTTLAAIACDARPRTSGRSGWSESAIESGSPVVMPGEGSEAVVRREVNDSSSFSLISRMGEIWSSLAPALARPASESGAFERDRVNDLTQLSN